MDAESDLADQDRPEIDGQSGVRRERGEDPRSHAGRERGESRKFTGRMWIAVMDPTASCSAANMRLFTAQCATPRICKTPQRTC
jgi:hypothetical protein